MNNLFNARFTYSQKKFLLIFILIFLLGMYFRFVNYDTRWTLSQDQARDALIADYSIKTNLLPLIGPHSSAGDFSFGPFYYWFIIFFKLFSDSIISSWIGFTILSCTTIVVFGLIGYKLFSKAGCIIFALVSALASSSILHSTDMLNPIPIPLFVSLIILYLIFFLKSHKLIYSFFIGTCIGLAINFHFEAFLLLPLLLITPSFLQADSRSKILGFISSLVGLSVSMIPLMIFDITHQNILSKNFFLYTFSGQQNASVTLSWLKEIISFWPQFFGEVLFNQPLMGYPVMIIIVSAFVICFIKKIPFPLTTKIIAITFLIQIFLLHFYNGVRSPVYMLVFHPIIIFLTSFSIYIFFKLNKYLGIILIVLFCLLTMIQNSKIIEQKNQLSDLRKLQTEIAVKSPGKILLFERPESAIVSLPLYYLYQYEDKLDSSGYRIGVCENKDLKDEFGQTIGSNCPKEPSPFGGDGHFQLFDLSNLSEDQLDQIGFTAVSEKKLFNNLYKNY